MLENGKPRKRRQLTPEEKWEVFLEVTSQELSQADAARKWNVDVSTVIRIRRLAKDAALAAFVASKPGRMPSPANDTSHPALPTAKTALVAKDEDRPRRVDREEHESQRRPREALRAPKSRGSRRPALTGRRSNSWRKAYDERRAERTLRGLRDNPPAGSVVSRVAARESPA
jgi:transposase-like protein